jgi:mannose-6-phosphate isomerase
MPDQMPLPPFLLLEPQYRDYVWGGQRLRPGMGTTAEAWIVYEQDHVKSGPFQGQTLAELASLYGEELLGEKPVRKTGNRFPLLVKLLDCADWLSLQVHPNDEQAIQLAGPGHFGKTEAWHTLDAAPGASIIAGLKPGVSPQAFTQAIKDGTIERQSQYLPLERGDTVLMYPGTLHALGPGLLIYEVQQTSELTYRAYDWGRPATVNRPLHIEQTLAVARPDARAELTPLPALQDGKEQVLCITEYFSLSMLYATSQPLALETHEESFHALTCIEGQARLSAGGDSLMLSPFDTALVPASTHGYQLTPLTSAFKALKSAA